MAIGEISMFIGDPGSVSRLLILVFWFVPNPPKRTQDLHDGEELSDKLQRSKHIEQTLISVPGTDVDQQIVVCLQGHELRSMAPEV